MPRPRALRNRRPPQRFAMRPSKPRSELRQVEEVKDRKQAAPWQVDAYNFVDTIGELRFAVNLKASVVGQCRLTPETRRWNEEKGQFEWQETNDPRVRRVLDAFRPPQGGQGELLRQAALHYEIAGDSWLYGEPVVDEFGVATGLLWEFLSVLEVEVARDGTVKRNRNGKGAGGRSGPPDDEVPPRTFISRFYRRDAKYSAGADSPVRAILPVAREVVLYTQVCEAIAKSRLAAGILYIPWEFSFGPEDESETVGVGAESLDDLEEELRAHLNAAVEDRASAASLLPLLMRGPAIMRTGDNSAVPAKDLLGIVDLARELDGMYRELRAEAIGRLAAGMDMPPEKIEGKSGLGGLGGGNVAQLVDEEFLAESIQPLGETIADFVTTNYLRPMLEVFERVPSNESEWFRVVIDLSPVSADPDQSAAATAGVSMPVPLLAGKAWRKANGFEESDAPDEEELYRRILERAALSSPSTLAPVLLPLLYPERPELAAALADVARGQAGGEEDAPLQLPGLGARLVDARPETKAAVLASADRDLERALEKAANRLIGRLGADRETQTRLRGLSKLDVLTVAGEETVRALAMTVEDLFEGSWDALTARVVEWLQQDLVGRGEDPYTARERATVAAGELAQLLTHHAGSAVQRRLVVGANGFTVPDEMLGAALSAGDLAARR